VTDTVVADVVAFDALGGSEVHVWNIDLARSTSDIGVLWAVLGSDETARAARFRFERDRVRFVVAHAATRQILGAYLGAAPAALRFDTGDHGKPRLASPWAESGLRFNLSHSYDVALCGVTRGRELGVDVERVRALEDLDGLATRVFSPRELKALGQLTGVARTSGFFNGWTRKEAFIKALGTGLSHPLERFDVSLTPGAPARLERVEGSEEQAHQWTLLDVGLDAECAAAIVVHGRDVRLLERAWPRDLPANCGEHQ
jgi:4'-phosphopantetheinyl transferase